MELEVPANFFSRELRTGGRVNQLCVDGLVFRSGKPFKSTHRPWAVVTFKQK